MKLWMTQSLLSSWQHFIKVDGAWADTAYQSFLAALCREPKERTRAMQMGILFETAVNDVVDGRTVEPVNEKWDKAVRRFAKLCADGQPQVPLAGELSVSGLDFVLFGICDYVKAGQIYDIKKVTRYEYGKYFDSPQHPMYLHLLPEAKEFDYLIFDGTFCYQEAYRRDDCKSIEEIITEFVYYLCKVDLLNIYTAHWAMDSKREEMINGLRIYKQKKT